MIRQFDTNGDGTITPDEVGQARRPFFERFARRAGLDPTKPIAVTTLRDALVNQGGQPGGGSGGSPSGSSGGTSGGASGATSGATNPAPSLVPGFGVPSTAPPVPGFGTPLAMSSSSSASAPSSTSSATTSTGSSSSAGSSSASSPSAAPDPGQMDSRIRAYAESLMRQYDKNKNGVLEREEWSQMRGNWRDADRNGDGVITLDELTAYLSRYSRQGPGGGSSGGGSSGGSSGSSSAARDPSQRKSYRFLTPKERLPAGLPDWFLRKDVDGDGQVTMAEFASEWTPEAAEEFAKYDLNGDGVITPAECLKAMGGR